jgi:hypothetical protein
MLYNTDQQTFNTVEETVNMCSKMSNTIERTINRKVELGSNSN